MLSNLGLNTQSAETTAAAAAAGLLPPMNIQSLAALAAMTQPSMPTATAAQPNTPLTNALLCKSFSILLISISASV